jgi:threonyl-tRNA synthetase
MSAQNHDLNTMRHSCAHLMAQAITRVFPKEHIEFGVGPVIDTGFYYDVEMDHRLTEEDLQNIENAMKEIIKENLPIERKVMPKDEAINFFKEQDQKLKVELIGGFPAGEEISCYTQGEFIDLCRGPHVESTGNLKVHFKLLNVAGAYWKGDSSRQMLQRVYAACFSDRKQLKQHLNFLQEAKKRDHRKLGKELGFFLFDQVSPGSPFFMPKGAVVYNQLVEYMRRIYNIYEYDEVITPQILDSSLWKTSGHYEHYHENMYFSQIDEREYAVKPMNCPCHMLMFSHQKYSYRDLPLRFADFGRLHRYEKAGAIAGLTRVRTFCQDDAHVFLSLDQVQEEITVLMDMFFTTYEHFGFNNIKVNLSTRPEKKSGDDATWDKAEEALKKALEASGHEYFIKEGDGAFYGPKIDVEISDALNRFWQLGTIQLDFQLPERFQLNFINSDNEKETPVVIHRALLGSLERFMGIYIEHTGGVFPFWLAPIQATIVPISSEKHGEYAKSLAEELRRSGLRIDVDDRNESIGYKTRQIQKSKIPFMLVIGDKEVEAKGVSARRYGEKHSRNLSIAELKEEFQNLMLEAMPEKYR